MENDPRDDAPPSDFGPLFAEVAPALFAWATLRVKPSLRRHVDPEDLVQEIAVRAFGGLSRFDPGRGPFRAWVFGIANHVLQKALERLARAQTWSETSNSDRTRALERIPEEATTVSRRVARDELLARFLERAASLDERDRGLLVFRGLMGMSHAEVAARLEMTTAAVEKRWQRLTDRLAAFGIPEGLVVAD